MARHATVPPDAETSGHVVAQVAAGLDDLPDDDAERGRAVLAARGFDDPRRDAWYSLREWIDALEELGATLGDGALTRLGRTVPAGVEWPPDADSARRGFATVNEAYHLNHRGGDVGYYEFVAVDDREQRVVCANPYPCAFDRGIIEGTLRAFAYEFTYPPMAFVRETGDRCRAEGGPRCEYKVTW